MNFSQKTLRDCDEMQSVTVYTGRNEQYNKMIPMDDLQSTGWPIAHIFIIFCIMWNVLYRNDYKNNVLQNKLKTILYSIQYIIFGMILHH